MDYLVDIEIPPLAKPYTYFLPEKWASLLDVGYRVQVPLGSRNAIGFITSKLSAVNTRLKELDGVDLKTISPSPVCHVGVGAWRACGQGAAGIDQAAAALV